MGSRTNNTQVNTGIADQILTELQIDQDCRALIFEFFVTFSRLESLLIENKYRQGRSDGSVDVSWNLFIDTSGIRAEERCLELVMRYENFLNDQPPKKLFPIPNSQNLEWRLPPLDQTALENRKKHGSSIQDFKELIVLLRRVRNNLFHGVKFRDAAEQTAARMMETLPILTDLKNLLLEIGPR